MTELPFPQRVGKTTERGLSCLFTGIHVTLKGWLRRKWSVPVLVGFQTLGAGKP